MVDVTFIKLLDQGVVGYALFAILVAYNIAKLVTTALGEARGDKATMTKVMNEQFATLTLASENMRRELSERNDKLETEVRELRESVESFMRCEAKPCPVRKMLQRQDQALPVRNDETPLEP